MTFTYPAIVTPGEKGAGFRVDVPDLAGCYAEGGDLEDALATAREEAEEWIRIELEEFDGDLPYASHPDDLTLSEGQSIRMILVTYRLLPDND